MTGVIHGGFTSGSLGGVRKEPPQQTQTSLTSSYLIFNKRQLLLGVGKFYIFFINCLHKHVENSKEEQELVKNKLIIMTSGAKEERVKWRYYGVTTSEHGFLLIMTF